MNIADYKNNKIVKIGLGVIVLAVVVVIVISLGGKKSGGKHMKGKVIGYLPYYSVDYLDKIDFDALTHLNIAFTNPDSSGNLSNQISDETMRKIVKTCHDNNVKAVASFGGGAISSTNYNALMRGNPEGITRFNETIINYCKEYELDGVDIDFEFIASSPAWEYFEDWMVALRKECKKNDLILSAAVASWYTDNISSTAMDCFDYIMIMAYDNNADHENHSTYEYAKYELEYHVDKGIDKDKLILGVPFYGYSYTQSGEMDWGSAASYRYILSKDSSAKNKDSSNGYAYNGEQTIKAKADLSKEYGGIMIWELSQDADGSNSLLKLIKHKYK